MSSRKLLSLFVLLAGLAAATWRATGQGPERVFLPVAVDARPAMTLVSRHSNGTVGNASSMGGQMSADGRYILFFSTATNLVDGDTNGAGDVFIHDRQAQQTTLFQRPPENDPSTGQTYDATISPDGRFLAFLSQLRAGDLSAYRDLFLFDRQTGQTTLVSRHSDGTPGNLNSRAPALSADGQYVAFLSGSTNLIDNDLNEFYEDVYVHDRQTGQTSLVSRHTNGTQGNRQSEEVSISADGRIVAFNSLADNLAGADTNSESDVFVNDRQTGQTTLISRGMAGASGNGGSWNPRLSADGRYVAFTSAASDLVSNDTQICNQIRSCNDAFVHDRQTGQTVLVSRHTNGTPGNSSSWQATISADGRFVAFSSWSTNLVDNDVNQDMDVFVHDRQTGRTTLVTYHVEESPLIRGFTRPFLSEHGQYVSFASDVSNLVNDDLNGASDVFVYDRGPTTTRR